jgi:hypothetical protein
VVNEREREKGRSHGWVGVLSGLPVRVSHGELVLIGEQRRRHGVGGRPHLRRRSRVGVVGAGVSTSGRRPRPRHPSLPGEGSAWGLLGRVGATEASPGGERKAAGRAGGRTEETIGAGL